MSPRKLTTLILMACPQVPQLTSIASWSLPTASESRHRALPRLWSSTLASPREQPQSARHLQEVVESRFVAGQECEPDHLRVPARGEPWRAQPAEVIVQVELVEQQVEEFRRPGELGCAVGDGSE
ncbi:MAG: hypothetical protein R2745_02035 [Vicinamibacterales bacterium]